MKLRTYYILAVIGGILTLVLSIGGALAVVQYLNYIPLEHGTVTGGHMSVMEFVIPLILIFLACLVFYFGFSLYCIFRKLKGEKNRVLHFLLNLVLYIVTTVLTLPLIGIMLN